MKAIRPEWIYGKQERKRWIVVFGTCSSVFYTEYHAEQFMRALRLNGTEYRIVAK